MKNNNYFTKIVDEAIIKYVLSEDRKEKEKIFKEIIEPTFRQLIEKVVYAYNFTGLKNLQDLKDDCFVSLISSLEKFNPNTGSKAFSYFTVITKNWFIFESKKDLKQRQMINNLSYYKNTLSSYELEDSVLKKEFFFALKNDVENWKSNNDKFNSILDAIKTMLIDINDFDFVNKGTIFFSLKEITGLKTSELTYLMKKVSKKYLEFKNKWYNENGS